MCQLDAAARKFILVAIYRPSSTNVTYVVFVLEAVFTYRCELVIVGDFNIHVDDLHDVTTLRLCDLLDAFGLVHHV